MNHRKIVALAGAAVLFSAIPAAPGWAASATGSRHASVVADPAQHGLIMAKGAAARAARLAARRSSPNMTYHGGKIMPTVISKAIFWGPSWTNSTFVGDKISGLNSWYTGNSGSNYAKTVDEYTDTVNGGHQVGSTGFTNQGDVIDTSTAAGGGNTTTILNEVAKEVAAGNITLDRGGNSYVPVYSDVPRGSAGYCAWHSSGTINGIVVQFGFFFNLDGDPGCDPGDTTTGHSQGLAALANVTAHELSEARSDPASPAAWYDSRGEENGDKCAWTFNVPSVSFPNGTKWKLQGEWSNAAYNAGTGYPNSSGQRGCLDGH